MQRFSRIYRGKIFIFIKKALKKNKGDWYRKVKRMPLWQITVSGREDRLADGLCTFSALGEWWLHTQWSGFSLCLLCLLLCPHPYCLLLFSFYLCLVLAQLTLALELGVDFIHWETLTFSMLPVASQSSRIPQPFCQNGPVSIHLLRLMIA